MLFVVGVLVVFDDYFFRPTEKEGAVNPRTREEWQEAANAAYFLLLVDAAREYGMTTGGPEVKIERCNWILAEARKRGITPAKDDVVREEACKQFIG